jgi:hypothetical protein
VKKYIPKPGVPTPTPKPGKDTGKEPRYTTQPVKPKPNPGKDDGRKTIMPVKPKPKRSHSNDTIRSLIKPDGTRVLRTSGKIRKSRGSR